MDESVKRINEEDAEVAMVDAIADLLHVYDGDDLALGEYVYAAWKSARSHYNAEAAGEDGIVVKVTRREEQQ